MPRDGLAVGDADRTAAQFESVHAEVTAAREALEAERRRVTDAIASYQQEYPSKLQFVYGTPKYEKPFLVRAIWNDGQFTYVKTDAMELPALYEIKDGTPSLLDFRCATARMSCRTYSIEATSLWVRRSSPSERRGEHRGDEDARAIVHVRHCTGFRPSARSARRVAVTSANVADGWCRRRDAGDHRADGASQPVPRVTSASAPPQLAGFLNRLPTITIREGHRVKVYLTSDLELPAYSDSEPTAASVTGARIR